MARRSEFKITISGLSVDARAAMTDGSFTREVPGAYVTPLPEHRILIRVPHHGIAACRRELELRGITGYHERAPTWTPKPVAELPRPATLRDDFKLMPFQEDVIKFALGRDGTLAQLPPGAGKCLGKGTPVLMYDGRICPVESIRVGDLLMGPDSNPRRVLSTAVGRGPLYRIDPRRGASWVCNEPHVLTLVYSGTEHADEVIDVPLDEYLRFSSYKRNRLKLFSVGVDFLAAEPLPLDPYFLGVWFGDGSKDVGPHGLRSVMVTKPDEEIRAACERMAQEYGLVVVRKDSKGTRCPTWKLVQQDDQRGGRSNPLTLKMRELLGDSLTVPLEYMTASRAERAAFLAGWIDTDGYASRTGVEIVQKRVDWAEAVAFVARSLGFHVSVAIKVVNGEAYRRLTITGDFTDVPIRIARKKPEQRKEQKDELRTGFSVTALGDGDYYGFELDGDGRFLLGDFTVTHNTPIAIYWSACHAGTTVVVTQANARVQWAREITRFTTHSTLVMDSNAGAPWNAVEAWPSGRMMIAPPLPEKAKQRPSVAMARSAAGVARQVINGEMVRVLVRLGKEEMMWRPVLDAKLAHLRKQADGSVLAMPRVRGTPDVEPGYVFTFGEIETSPLPKYIVLGWQMLAAYTGTLATLKLGSVVFDESQTAKAHRRYEGTTGADGTTTYQRLDSITAQARRLTDAAGQRLATTATPVMDRPRDLWAQVDLIAPWEFGKYRDYAHRYCDQHVGTYGRFDDTGKSNVGELLGRLDAVRIQVPVAVTHAQLPPKRRSVFYLPESEQNDPGDFRAEKQAAAIQGPGALREVLVMEAAAKKRGYAVSRIQEIVEGGGKVLVFTGRKRDCELLETAVRKALKKVECEILMGHGGTATMDRQALLDTYRSTKLGAVLIGTGDAWGTAMDGLQCSDLQLHLMLPLTGGQVIQREGRVHRHGMTKSCLIEYVIAEGTSDERIAELLLEKLPAMEAVAQNEEIEGLGEVMAVGDDSDAVRAGTVQELLAMPEDSIED